MTCSRKVLISTSSQVFSIPLLLPMIQVAEYLKTDSYILQVRKFQKKQVRWFPSTHFISAAPERVRDASCLAIACSLLSKGKDQHLNWISTGYVSPLLLQTSLVVWLTHNWCYLFFILLFKYVAVKRFSVFQGKKMRSTLDEFEVWKKGGTRQ